MGRGVRVAKGRKGRERMEWWEGEGKDGKGKRKRSIPANKNLGLHVYTPVSAQTHLLPVINMLCQLLLCLRGKLPLFPTFSFRKIFQLYLLKHLLSTFKATQRFLNT